jgi:hypothetical protein
VPLPYSRMTLLIFFSVLVFFFMARAAGHHKTLSAQ